MTMIWSGPGSGPNWATVSTWWARPATWAMPLKSILDRLPEVVLLDVHLPSGTGADVINGVVSAGKTDVKFLALSVSDAPDDVIASSGRAPVATSPRQSPATIWSMR